MLRESVLLASDDRVVGPLRQRPVRVGHTPGRVDECRDGIGWGILAGERDRGPVCSRASVAEVEEDALDLAQVPFGHAPIVWRPAPDSRAGNTIGTAAGEIRRMALQAGRSRATTGRALRNLCRVMNYRLRVGEGARS